MYTHELAGVHELTQCARTHPVMELDGIIEVYSIVCLNDTMSIFFHNPKWTIPESFQIHKINLMLMFFLQSQIQEMCGIGYGVYRELCRLLD